MRTTTLNKYIEINNLSNPQKAFERMDNEFIDIMYEDHYSHSSVIMLLDLGIDPLREDDLAWLKELLDTFLSEVGETPYYLTPFTPKQ